MSAIEFIKVNYTLTNGGEDYVCNHSGQLVGAEDIADAYHQAKLKLLGIGDVGETFIKTDLLELGGWFDGSPEFVEEVVNDWLNAR